MFLNFVLNIYFHKCHYFYIRLQKTTYLDVFVIKDKLIWFVFHLQMVCYIKIEISNVINTNINAKRVCA